MEGLEWNAPWLTAWRDPGKRVAVGIASGVALDEALNLESTVVRFVPQHELPPGTAYEQFIFETGQCPVREGLHDFFNGLAWLKLPQAKRQLNRLQAAEIARDGVGASRGPVRDAITVFDENGALLAAPAPIWDALLAREWLRLFVDLRPLWAEAQLLVFGHALLEQLAQPRKNLTAHVWTAGCPLAGDADGWLAAQLTGERLARKPFTPLPVLGVPGWCPENVNFSFYDDSLVFRPARRQNPGQQRQARTPPPLDSGLASLICRAG